MLIALALLLRDPLKVLAFLTEGENLVLGIPGLLLEDVLVDFAQNRPLGGVVQDRCGILRVCL